MPKPEAAWKKIGQEDPYYGVSTWEGLRRENMNDQVLKEFLLSGDREWAQVLGIIRRHLDVNFAPQRGLDFGCGVGRLTIPMARVCRQVVGADISEAMLAEARKNCANQGLENVDFILSDDELSRLVGVFDLIYSYIVFQHIPPAQGEKLVSRLLERLAPGGIAVLHFVYGRERVSYLQLRRLISWCRHHLPGVHDLINRLDRRHPPAPLIQMNVYHLNRLMAIFQRHDLPVLVSQFTNHGGYLGIVLYGKKRSPVA